MRANLTSCLCMLGLLGRIPGLALRGLGWVGPSLLPPSPLLLKLFPCGVLLLLTLADVQGLRGTSRVCCICSSCGCDGAWLNARIGPLEAERTPSRLFSSVIFNGLAGEEGLWLFFGILTLSKIKSCGSMPVSLCRYWGFCAHGFPFNDIQANFELRERVRRASTVLIMLLDTSKRSRSMLHSRSEITLISLFCSESSVNEVQWSSPRRRVREL
mmetsp:Transcript_32550/g.103106  ORF Transcript_32550/g.103106 Transcript_32550/m.103106 type:complete len:214 (+) Transcript_32550:540-1181(+)